MSPQPARNEDLHGNAPDACPVALLIVDMINDLDFPGNDYLIQRAPALAENIAVLKARSKRHGIPVIYANDNRGLWRSDAMKVIAAAMRPESKGREMVAKIAPEEDDYIVLKPKHSAFYATPLDVILEYLGVKVLIVAGISTNSCVLLTAMDVYVRDLQLRVIEDCVAGQSEEEHRAALAMMEQNFGTHVCSSRELNLDEIMQQHDRSSSPKAS